MLSRLALRPARTLGTQVRHMSYQAPPALQKWATELASLPADVSTENMASGRALQLLRTLPTRAGTADALYGNLPKAFHLIYFQPNAWLNELAADGTTTEYNAPVPFARRMWAGGAFEWNPATQLKVNEDAIQSISVGGVSVKSDKMMFVKQLREFRPASAAPGEWAVREERNHVFQPLADPKGKPKPKPSAADMPKAEYTFSYTPSSPLLFRYSALTLNAHKIHYDLTWAQQQEGHTDLVVHGPMTATLLIELAERAAKEGTNLTRFEYRATSPMYVDREIRLQAAWDVPGEKLNVWAEQEGSVGMKATAIFTPHS